MARMSNCIAYNAKKGLPCAHFMLETAQEWFSIQVFHTLHTYIPIRENSLAHDVDKLVEH